ncbi:hypothetical protein GF322_01335 [Candidatus Dependentiae bacterium]|nr:hypothetical protein [Candidatus Dependentiae bacterium]
MIIDVKVIKKEICGTNIDNSKNKEYCIHCFKKGELIYKS